MGKYYKYKNLEENRFQEFDKSDILSGPLHIAIDITNKCNAKCLHCFNRSGNGLLRNEISDREMLEIFKEIAVIKPFSTCFCGGEPMMKYDLVLRATEVLKDFIGSVLINYKNEVKKDSKKIRISFENKDTEIYKELIQSLIELSFIKVAELKDELTIGQDVLIYDYFY